MLALILFVSLLHVCVHALVTFCEYLARGSEDLVQQPAGRSDRACASWGMLVMGA